MNFYVSPEAKANIMKAILNLQIYKWGFVNPIYFFFATRVALPNSNSVDSPTAHVFFIALDDEVLTLMR